MLPISDPNVEIITTTEMNDDAGLPEQRAHRVGGDQPRLLPAARSELT